MDQLLDHEHMSMCLSASVELWSSVPMIDVVDLDCIVLCLNEAYKPPLLVVCINAMNNLNTCGSVPVSVGRTACVSQSCWVESRYSVSRAWCQVIPELTVTASPYTVCRTRGEEELSGLVPHPWTYHNPSGSVCQALIGPSGHQLVVFPSSLSGLVSWWML